MRVSRLRISASGISVARRPLPTLRSIVRHLLPVLLLLISVPAQAQTLDEIDKREAAVIEAWQQTPLTIRRAIFVASDPELFGNYEPRQSNTFKPGEKLLAYVEPVGYSWKDSGDGFCEFGFDVDFLLKSPDGKILTGKENFAHLVKKSRNRLREFFVTLTMNVSGAPPGDYVLEYKLRDISGNKSTVMDLPFKIAE